MNIPGVVSLTETGVSPAIQGAVTLTEGTNITLTQSGQAITIAAAGAPLAIWAPTLATSGAFSETLVGGGTTTYNNSGITITTSATASSSVNVRHLSDSGHFLFSGNRMFVSTFRFSVSGSDYHSFYGLGLVTVAGSGITYTPRHFGFKGTRAASGTALGLATNADGTTEKATDISGINYTQISAVKTGTTNIRYYKDGALQATHTTNLPVDNFIDHSPLNLAISNVGVASNSAAITWQMNATSEANVTY